MSKLTAAEVEQARRWWNKLPDSDKGGMSIYMILAMYAQDRELGRPQRVPKREHTHVLDTEREKA